jgi:RimJ/RimL family protein N-acetyltransferase
MNVGPAMDDHRSGMTDLDVPVVETERLILRGFREADLDGLFALAQDPLIAEYVNYNNAPLREACWRSIALWMGHWALRGFGIWAVEVRSTGTLAGRIGLWQPEGWPGTEVGWLLGRAFWGQGYATEAARASLDWGFTHLDVQELVSLIRPDNAPSIAVAERIGERFRGEVPFRGGTTGEWVITRAEWGERRAAGG